jgi:putative phosphoribosyl transferase
MGARAVVLAAPVGAADSVRALAREADRVVVLAVSHPFEAVGKWYRSFAQTSDGEVIALLEKGRAASGDHAPSGLKVRSVHIPVGGAKLQGELVVPAEPRGLVIFAHGSGSSRKSPRNQHVAAEVSRHGFATLLFDLLTAREEAEETMTGELRFDIPFLAARLHEATKWARAQPGLEALPVGYFGASTGAAAALTASALPPSAVRAVVSRGGRPDLSAVPLEAVTAATLLIVGGDDRDVLALNRAALSRLSGPRHLHVVPGAGHLFEEAGALDEVARAACEWFEGHLAGQAEVPRAPALRPWGEVAS